ncbi:hypothetical protein [Acinetobacter sp. ANC 5378]
MEAILVEHPDVIEAAVIGIPDEHMENRSKPLLRPVTQTFQMIT